MRRNDGLTKFVSVVTTAALLASYNAPMTAWASTVIDGQEARQGQEAQPAEDEAPVEDVQPIDDAGAGIVAQTLDTGDESVPTVVSDEPVAKVGETGYISVQAAINAAGQAETTVTLRLDVTESITIAAGQNITLDLNGHTITNSDDNHTITNNGTLTVTDSSTGAVGTVDNISHAKAALLNQNNASCTVLAGALTRSAEAGVDANNNGGNSFYAVDNYGTMTFGAEGGENSRISVTAIGKYSSLIHNGWQNTNDAAGKSATMTVYGGTFTGGLNTIKNDENGTLTIQGGTFEGAAQYALMNWNNATINDGIFTSVESAVFNGADSETSTGQLTITGGLFTSGDKYYVVYHYTGKPDSKVQISGGTYSSQYISNDGSCYADDFELVKDADGTYSVVPNVGIVATITSADGATTTTYDSLEVALADLGAGETLSLVTDVQNDDYDNVTDISLPAGATLNGKGYTLSGNIAVHVNAAGGTVQNVNFKDIHNSKNNLSAVYASGLTGELTITGCEFDTCDWDAIQTTPQAGASINITNNTFRNTGEQGVNTHRYIHVESDKKNTDFSITATRNKFYDADKLHETALEVYYPKSADKVSLRGNYFSGTASVCVLKGSGTNAYELTMPFSDDSLQKEVWPIAAVSADSYNRHLFFDLQSAVDSADNNKATTITLQSDVDSGSVAIPKGKNITIAANGKKIVSDFTNEGSLLFSGDSSEGSGGIITNTTDGSVTFKGNSATAYSIDNSGHLIITSGVVYDLRQIEGSGSVSISGGTFSSKPNDEWIAEWYVANALEDNSGYYKVQKMTNEQAAAYGAVASDSANGIATTRRYFNSISSGLTYSSTHALTDVKEDIVASISSTYFRNLYANGNKIAGSLSIDMSGYTGNNLKYVALRANNGGSIDLTSAKTDAELRAYDGSVVLDGVDAPSVAAGSNSTAGDLTIKGGTIGTATAFAAGKLNIQEGHFESLVVNTYRTSGETEPSRNGELIVTGGTFKSSDVTVQNYQGSTVYNTASKPLSDFVLEGYEVVNNGDGTYTVQQKAATYVATVIAADGTQVQYASLAEAFAGASSGSTVQLIADVANLESIKLENTSEITFDLYGHTAKFSKTAFTICQGSKLTVRDSAGTTGKLEGLPKDGDAVIEVDNATFILESGEIAGGDNNYGVSASNNGSVTVKNGSITSGYAALAGNNTTGDMNFEVSGGTLTAQYGPAIYMPGQKSLKISGGTINGGISLRMGQVEISGGTINATKGNIDMPDKYYNYSGNAWLPDALYVFGGTYTSDNTDFGNSLNLNITGGTFNCENGQGSAVAIYDLGRVAQATSAKISGNAILKTNAENRSAYQVLNLSDLGVDNPAVGYNHPSNIGKVASAISGGTFSTPVAADYCANGYVPIAEADETSGLYTVNFGPEIMGRTLTLDGRIGMNYYVDFGSVSEADRSKYSMHFTVNGKESQIVDFNVNEKNTFDGATYYRFACFVDSRQMSDEITARLYCEGAPVSKAYVYAVRDYAYRMIETTSDQTLVSLLKAMLNYGGYAQVHFENYNGDNLAYSGLGQTEIDAVKSAAIPGAYDREPQGELPIGLTNIGATLLLNSQVDIRLYMTLENGSSIDSYSFWIDGEKVEPIACSGSNPNGSHYVEIPSIQANKLDDFHKIGIGLASEDSPSWTMEYSALTYAYKMANSDDGSIVNLVKALYLYNDAANKFTGWVD